MKTKLLTILIALAFAGSTAYGQSAKPAKTSKSSKTEQTRVICIVNSDTVITEGDSQGYRWESKSDGQDDGEKVIIIRSGDAPDDIMTVNVIGPDGMKPGKGEKVIVTKEVIADGQSGGKARVHTIKVVNGDTVTNEISEEAIEGFRMEGCNPQEFHLRQLNDGDGQNVTVDVKDLGDGKQMVIVRARKVRIEALEDAEAKELGDSKGLQLKDLSYAPNPNQGRFTLSFRIKEHGPASVRIHSLDGRELFREDLAADTKQYSREIDLGDVPAGVYLLEVQQGSQKAVRRIVVE